MAQDEASLQANRSGMDPRRLVVIFLLLFGFILALFLEHVLHEVVWAGFQWGDPPVIEGLDESRITNVLGGGVAIGLMLFAWLHPRPKQLLLDVAGELMKVTWPSWGETRVSTIAVVVASVVASVILFAIDTIAYKLMVEWLPAVWGKL